MSQKNLLAKKKDIWVQVNCWAVCLSGLTITVCPIILQNPVLYCFLCHFFCSLLTNFIKAEIVGQWTIHTRNTRWDDDLVGGPRIWAQRSDVKDLWMWRIVNAEWRCVHNSLANVSPAQVETKSKTGVSVTLFMWLVSAIMWYWLRYLCWSVWLAISVSSVCVFVHVCALYWENTQPLLLAGPTNGSINPCIC